MIKTETKFGEWKVISGASGPKGYNKSNAKVADYQFI